MSDHAKAAHQERVPHVLGIPIYAGVWIALLVLTVVTVAVSYKDLGSFNIVVAMAVATVKASLVALFFMHLKYDERFNALVFVSSLGFLGIFFILTLADTAERGRVDPLERGQIELVPGRPELNDLAAPSGEGDHGAAPGGESPGAADGHENAGDSSDTAKPAPSGDPGGH